MRSPANWRMQRAPKSRRRARKMTSLTTSLRKSWPSWEWLRLQQSLTWFRTDVCTSQCTVYRVNHPTVSKGWGILRWKSLQSLQRTFLVRESIQRFPLNDSLQKEEESLSGSLQQKEKSLHFTEWNWCFYSAYSSVYKIDVSSMATGPRKLVRISRGAQRWVNRWIVSAVFRLIATRSGWDQQTPISKWALIIEWTIEPNGLFEWTTRSSDQ